MHFAADLDLAATGDQISLERSVEAMARYGAIRASLERLRFRAAKALPITLAELPQAHPPRTLLCACSVL